MLLLSLIMRALSYKESGHDSRHTESYSREKRRTPVATRPCKPIVHTCHNARHGTAPVMLEHTGIDRGETSLMCNTFQHLGLLATGDGQGALEAGCRLGHRRGRPAVLDFTREPGSLCLPPVDARGTHRGACLREQA